MFKKKPNIKTLSPLRSSDRRKTADKIIADFGIDPNLVSKSGSAAGTPPTGNQDDAEAKAAAAAAHTALRNLVLPDNCLTAKFTTTSGYDLVEVSGTVYVGSHGSKEQRILWVSIRDQLYPTVYSLWRIPGLLPLLHTPLIVINKMRGGADLMLPGLAGPPFPAKAKKGKLVAVASLDNPSVPVAVGTCAVDICDLRSVQGAKGHAVDTFHMSGDELWDWSTSGKSGTVAPESLDGWIQDDTAGLASGTKALDLEDDADDAEAGGGVSLQPEKPQHPPRNQFVEGAEELVEAVEQDVGESMSTQEIDEAFRQAFMYGVYNRKVEHSPPRYGLDFPLTQSFVMSDLVLPFLPTFTQKQIEALVIKKTSWKNIRKFIKALEKNKLLLSKDRQGNETTVATIDFDDHAFADFRPYRLPKKDPGAGGSQTAATNGSEDAALGQSLKRIELFRAKDSLALLFKHSRSAPKGQHTRSDIGAIVSSYVESENLVKPNNKRLITLDPFLGNSLFNPTGDRLDAELLAQGSVPRDVLVDRVLKTGCNPFHAILRGDETLDGGSAKAKPGPAPVVEVQQETRSGNKTVTRVWGLDAFFVNPQSLADELRKTCASSTSVEASKHGKGTEVMVQGPQQAAVVAALERRGVNKQWVEVHKMKGKKK